MIDISNCDRAKLIQKAYDLSLPAGLGYIHYIPDHKLTEEETKRFIGPDGAIFMDYVGGRRVKFKAWMEGDKLVTEDSWRDHTAQDLQDLIAHARA